MPPALLCVVGGVTHRRPTTKYCAVEEPPVAAFVMSKRPRNESAQLALVCVQNALSMGAQTQLQLCPAPQRRSLRAALRRRATERQQELQNMSIVVSPQQVGLESFLGREQLEDYHAQEEEFLLKDDTDSEDEKFSSGDEDELREVSAMFNEESVDLNKDAEYLNISEQLYSPFVLEQGEPAQEPKLPFNWRKMQFFDSVSSEDKSKARDYLKSELRRLKKRSAQAYSRSLEVAARRRTGELVQEEIEDVFSVSHFPYSMSPCIASALIAESLSMNPHESIEGMASCYEEIVSAGVAVLDAPDPTQPTRTRNSRSEIMTALAPILVTTLEQASGEVILSLAKLRRMCATDRYARRFVQRIGPALVRPPGAAMWCLRHQNDMEAILAATELLLDAAFDVFVKGWYDRGRWIKADSKRAETLSAAAQQLRSLSHEPGLAFTHVRRTRKKDEEPLAEWEVIAVDRQIRASISNMLQSDWSKSTLTPVPKPLRHRSTSNASSVRSSRTPRLNASPRESRPEDKERSGSPPPPPSPIRPSEKDSPTQTPVVVPPTRSPRSPARHAVDLSPQNRITPLSPSSIGTSTSMADMITYRPTPPGPREYRMLTSTAAERKRTVAACRALRAQISRFEEAFIRLHGRPPKGAADRAPLATTYAQYREWKRAIRADAACRIQALFRGALCRWMLLRSGNTQMVEVIRNRAGQRRNLPPSIPTDGDEARSLAAPSPWSQDPFPDQPSQQQSAQEDLSQLPAAELQMRKRDLKQQLKKYDIEFVQRHGRMPLKAEKEPIRHLYESYNRLKGQINQMQRDGPRRAPSNNNSTAATGGVPQRSVSPSSGSESEDSPARPGPFSSRQQRNHRHHLPTSPSTTATPTTTTPNTGGDLAALRAEKQNLHAMLRSYERDFFRENRRQVSSFADIRPVASQYRRYKEIKRAMAAIQQNAGGAHQQDDNSNVRR